MKLDVYVMVYNEELLLPYFLKHYGSFAQNIYAFYDKGTDKSREILSRHPKVTIFDLKEHGLNEGYWISNLWTKYEELSRGKADWVVLVDVDEFLYHPNLIEILKREKKLGTQLIQPQGFTMFSDNLPTTAGQIYEEVKNGLPDYWASQCCLFDPDIYIRFRKGCHSIARQQKNILFKNGRSIEIKMLHYRYFGRKYLEDRDAKNFSRYFIGATPPASAIIRWKSQNHQLPDKTRGNRYEWFEKHKSEAVNVVDNMIGLTYILNKYQLKKNKARYKLYCSREGSLSVLFKGLGFNLGALIGIETGRFAKCLLTINPSLKLYTVDTWGQADEKLSDKARERLTSFNCQIVKTSSLDAAKRFADKSLDFVYLNTYQDPKNAMNEIKEWSKKVRKGGIVAGNDYSDDSNGKPAEVKKAINKWVKKSKIRSLFIFLKNSPPTWFFVK